MIYQTKGGRRRVKQFDSQLIIVNFYFVLPLFQIQRIRLSLVFLIYVQFCTIIAVPHFLEPFHQTFVLARLENSFRMLSSTLSTVFQVTKNQSTSTVHEIFNRYQTKSRFLINNFTIKPTFDWSM